MKRKGKAELHENIAKIKRDLEGVNSWIGFVSGDGGTVNLREFNARRIEDRSGIIHVKKANIIHIPVGIEERLAMKYGGKLLKFLLEKYRII